MTGLRRTLAAFITHYRGSYTQRLLIFAVFVTRFQIVTLLAQPVIVSYIVQGSEVTSALDSKSEEKAFDVIHESLSESTLIVVSHHPHDRLEGYKLLTPLTG